MRYRLGQATIVMFGLLIFAFVVIQRDFSTLQYIGMGIAVFGLTIPFPLCYLRALRHFVRDLEKTESDDERTT